MVRQCRCVIIVILGLDLDLEWSLDRQKRHLEGDSILTKIRLSGNGTAGAYLAERVKDKGHFVVVD